MPLSVPAARLVQDELDRRLPQTLREARLLEGHAPRPGAQFKKENFGLGFGLKTPSSFGLRFPTAEKIDSLNL